MSRDVLIFGDKRIRRSFVDGAWFFSVVDVVSVLDVSLRPRKYWADLKFKLIEEGFQLSDFIGQLKMESSDGKKYLTDCANLKGIFRIIQSIPSRKVEPFKLWLAPLDNPWYQTGQAKGGDGKIRKVYKDGTPGMFEIFPSDPFESLDDPLFEVFIDLGGDL